MRRVDFMFGGKDFNELTAEIFMTADPYYYYEHSTTDRVATALTMGGFGSVPIVDSGKIVVGIVSEFDLLKAILSGKELEQIKAGEIMTRDPVTVREETKAPELMELLQRKHLIRVPVIDGEGCLVGVCARRDILLGYLKARETPPPWW